MLTLKIPWVPLAFPVVSRITTAKAPKMADLVRFLDLRDGDRLYLGLQGGYPHGQSSDDP
jgi:hypothetical protein